MKLYKLKNVFNPKRTAARFADKAEAKAARDELNGGLNTDPEKNAHWNKDQGYRITIAEDHWRYA